MNLILDSLEKRFHNKMSFRTYFRVFFVFIILLSFNSSSTAYAARTVDIGDGTNPSNSTVAPGSSATNVDGFSLQVVGSGGGPTDTVTAVTVSIANASSTSLLEITDTTGATVYGSTANPTGTSVVVTLGTSISVSTTLTEYRIRITPKSQANLPAPVGSSYAVTATVTGTTGTYGNTGTDTSSATITIDNLSTANVTSSTATAGIGQATTTYTNPADSDLNSVVILRSSSAVTDIPVEGTTYTVGNTIGSATVACVDTVVTPSASDSCLTTGLTNGVTYHFKVFAKDNNGNYSTGLVPTGSPVTIPNVTTLADGTNPSSVTIAPGGTATEVNSFTLQTSSSTDVITAITLNISNASSTSLIEITNSAGTIVYGSNANPTGATTVITLSQNTLTATVAATTYKVRITPKSQANLPVPIGSSYAVTSTVSTWTGTNSKAGADATSATVTIDNLSTANVTSSTVTAGDGSATTTYTTPGDADLNSIVILRSTSAITNVLAEGTTYTGGESIGVTTVACVDTTVSPSTADSCVSTGLTNGVSYHFKVFAKDNYGNYSTGLVPTGSPVTPTLTPGTTTLANTTNPGDTTIAPGSSATFVDSFTLQTSNSGDTITDITLNISNASSTSLVEVTNSAGTTVYGSTTNPTGTTTLITLSQNTLMATSTISTYKIRITPKSQADLPSGTLGRLYPIRASIASWTGTNAQVGTDISTTTITIDNQALPSFKNSNISYATKADYMTGTTPHSVTAADLNNDGYVDLAVVNLNSNSVSVFINNGNGTYAAKVDYTTGTNPYSVTSADLNNDGYVDLAVANGNSNSVSVFINNSDGTYAAKVDYTTGSDPDSISAADLNNDGYVDLAVANYNSASVSVFINNGNGTYATKVDYTTGTNPWSVTSADLNNDGYVDLAVANYNSASVSVFINNGNGTYAAKVDYTTGTYPRSVTSDDLNNDGYVDLAVANELSNSVSVFINNGNGTYAAKVDYTTGTNPFSVTSADLNNDGYVDLAVANTVPNSVSVFINNGNGTYAAKVDYTTGSFPISVTSADLNNDGYVDLAVTNYNSNSVSVFINNSSSTLTSTAGGGQVTLSYTTPPTSDINTVLVLRSISAVTDVPVEGTTYTGGETIGSATVACVDTTIATSTADSCVATGIVAGTAYHFKVFAKDNYGNYSTGLIPTGSPVTIPITTTLANGTNPSSITIAPGDSATEVNSFTLQTSSSTDVITNITLNISNASSTSLIEITNDAGSTVYGSTTNPTGTTTIITLNQNTLTANTSLTQYKVRITPKSQANLPSPSIGMLYPITAIVSTWAGTNPMLGMDASSSIVTIDNDMPSTTGDAGIVWATSTSAANNYWFSVAYGNGLFVAISSGPGSNNRVMTSPDGITWSTRTSAADNVWRGVTYGNGLFVAVAWSGTGDRVMTSPDGITWTSRTSATDNQWRSVTYGNGLFVAVAESGTGDRVMTSPDGITWTSRTSAVDQAWYSVVYGNSIFVAVSLSGSVMTSPDGITWTSRTSAANNAWYSVAYGNSLFVAVASSGSTSTRVMSSPDGINWTSRTAAVANLWTSVTYGNGLFVAVAESGSGNRVMTSTDGITWTSRTSAVDNSWQSVTYGNGLFVAISTDGTDNRVMFSTSTLPTASIGNTQITLSYTTPGDSDLNSIVVLRSSSAVTDVPVEGTTYTGGETIGSATVACVDTTVSTSTLDSCVSTGLTNGVPYHFKVFAKDNYGNYSTGLVPVGSPITPSDNATTTTLANGTDPASVTVAPGASATSTNSFTFQTSTSTDVITNITLNISNASSTSLIEITNDVGTVVYGSTTNPTGTSVAIPLAVSITASTTPTEYRVRITPKTQTNLPRASLGMTYTVKTNVISWTGTNVNKLGSDVSSSTLTIDNEPPATSGNSGFTWSTSTSAVDNSWQSVAYGNGVFVAVAQSGTNDRVMTSTDGTTWTSRTSSADNSWSSVVYGNEKFVAVSYTGTDNRVMTSPTGSAWSTSTTPVDNNWKSVTYGNGLFVAVSDSGTGDRVMTSPDGITWATSSSAVDSNWKTVAYGNGIFVALADSGSNQLMTSINGLTWTARNTPNANQWYSVTFGDNQFVAVSQDGANNRVMTSPDGINWTIRTSAADYTWTSVAYGNGLYVAVASDGGSQHVMTSPDGYVWSLKTSAADNLWNSVAYGDGMFASVSNSGSSNRGMVSTSSSVTVVAGDTQATTTYTTPGDSDLHSVIILTSTSTITDVPVEGTTYTLGNTIGSSTVACVDTTVSTSTADSCVTTGLTNGTPYYFKIFARDNYGNYSSGISPDGSPATPSPSTPSVTLADGTNPSNSTVAPGGATTTVDAFVLSTNTGNPTVTDVTVSLANASSTKKIQITDDAGSVIYGSSTYPTGASVVITLTTPIVTTTTPTQYKIQILPKSQSELPGPTSGVLYAVTATVSSYTTTATPLGTDAASATITIDNLSPAAHATSSSPSATAGNTQITISYTTPEDSDLNSMVVLRSSSAVTDVPVEGVTYTGGETIGSATVACVDDVVVVSTADSCAATGLTNGVPYYLMLFAKDNYGNYSTGTEPTGSPVTPIPGVITVTLDDGTEAGNSTIAPGSSAVNIDVFTIKTDYSTSSISSVVVATDYASSTSLIEIINDAGSVVYGSTTNPTGATTSISLSTNITANTTLTNYRIRITPKSQANLPGPSTGVAYLVTSVISDITISTGTKVGTDSLSSTITIDNESPSNTSTSTGSAGNAQVTIGYTNPSNSDLHSIVVLRSTSAVTNVPAEGSTYTVGNTIGGATVACVDTTVTPSASDLCFATGLTNDTPYHFKVFAKDLYGNYSTGQVPGGSPVTPSVSASASRVDSYRIRKDDGNEVSATYYMPENTELTGGFFIGDSARIRFVVSNQGGSITNISYKLEYSSSTCTTWVAVPKVSDAIASDPVRTSTSYYVYDSTITTHSSGVSIPSGKSFVAGYLQTFGNITQAIQVGTSEYTEVEYIIRSTSAMVVGVPYCFRVTDSGNASSFTYLQTPSIISKKAQFRPQAGGGGAGFLITIEANSAEATTTQTGGGEGGGSASTTEATTTPDAPQSTTTPSQGGDGGGDLGYFGTSNIFAYSNSPFNGLQGMVLGVSTERVCVNFRNRMYVGRTDAVTNGEVSLLQYYLKQLGYFNTKETGYFGEITDIALKNFQRDHNLIVTGIAGKITRDKLNENTCNTNIEE
ncbi:FG-GAP-like repeat-containing protein [Candidatus Gracilibacteria bacterium]|nr:FG-GAP-like repeat-containing protein [Candidatus Gracilibacteria bacterium]